MATVPQTANSVNIGSRLQMPPYSVGCSQLDSWFFMVIVGLKCIAAKLALSYATASAIPKKEGIFLKT